MQGVPVFEPIPALTSLMMSLQNARFGDQALESAIAALGGAVRQARPSELPAWPRLYRDALRLMDAALQAQLRIDDSKTRQQSWQLAQQQLQTVTQTLESVASQQRMDWGPRLRVQFQGEQGLLPIALTELEQLPVATTEDPTAGLTKYAIEPEALERFIVLVQGLEKQILDNNQQLISLRANEALKARNITLPQGLDFFIEAATLRAGRPALPLEGVQKPTPSSWEFVGAIHRTAMGIITGVSGVGLIVGRVINNGVVSQVLTLLGLLAFLLGFAFAAFTVPPRVRQGRAQIRLQAQRDVQQQLRTAIEKHLGALEQRYRKIKGRRRGKAAAAGVRGPASAARPSRPRPRPPAPCPPGPQAARGRAKGPTPAGPGALASSPQPLAARPNDRPPNDPGPRGARPPNEPPTEQPTSRTTHRTMSTRAARAGYRRTIRSRSPERGTSVARPPAPAT